MATYDRTKADDAPFTVAADSVYPSGMLCDESGTDSVDEGDAGIPRMTADRKALVRVVGSTDSVRQEVEAGGRVPINPISGQAGVQGGSGVVTALTQRVVLATDVVPPAAAIPANRTVTATLGALNDAITIDADGLASIVFEIQTGLVSTVLAFEATMDDSTWFGINAMTMQSGAQSGAFRQASTSTIPNRGVIIPTGWSQVRIRVSTYVSGSSAAYMAGCVATGIVSVANVFPGNSPNSLGKNEDAAHASADIGVMALAVREDSPGDLSNADGDYEPLQVSGGLLWARLRGLQTPNGDSVLDDTLDAVKVAQATAANLNAQVVGPVADDGSTASNPVVAGLRARQTNRTAVSADNDVVAAMGDDMGRFVVVPHQVRDLCGDQATTITSSTSVTTIVTADASNMLDLVSLVLANTSGTGTEVTLYDDDGTTVRATFYVPASDTRGVVFSVPFKQTAVNKAWKLKTVTSIASLKIMAQFVKNV